MANPMLVLAGITLSVVVSAFGIVTVPGWVTKAQNAAAFQDLDNIANLQSVAYSVTHGYAAGGELKERAKGEEGMQLTLSTGMEGCTVVSPDREHYLSRVVHESGRNFFRMDKGQPVMAANAEAGYIATGAEELGLPFPELGGADCLALVVPETAIGGIPTCEQTVFPWVAHPEEPRNGNQSYAGPLGKDHWVWSYKGANKPHEGTVDIYFDNVRGKWVTRAEFWAGAEWGDIVNYMESDKPSIEGLKTMRAADVWAMNHEPVAELCPWAADKWYTDADREAVAAASAKFERTPDVQYIDMYLLAQQLLNMPDGTKLSDFGPVVDEQTGNAESMEGVVLQETAIVIAKLKFKPGVIGISLAPDGQVFYSADSYEDLMKQSEFAYLASSVGFVPWW